MYSANSSQAGAWLDYNVLRQDQRLLVDEKVIRLTFLHPERNAHHLASHLHWQSLSQTFCIKVNAMFQENWKQMDRKPLSVLRLMRMIPEIDSYDWRK